MFKFSFIGDDSGTEWYEEPITIVGFVAGFLLFVLIIASILILCYSKEDDEDDEEQGGQSGTNHVTEGLGETNIVEHDRTNPLYISANEFDLQPLPPPLRAKFVHIHVDEPRITREGFESYYNTGLHSTETYIAT